MDLGKTPYRLSKEAKQDLARIYWHGYYQFGQTQAGRYLAALLRRFGKISASPFMYPSVDHIREGYRRSICGVDSIFYRLNGDTVEIMRILGRQEIWESDKT
tara:strand:+ start:94 stop:399 length:306 start_codon:yes stop_codon:yes gene_type:complete